MTNLATDDLYWTRQENALVVKADEGGPVPPCCNSVRVDVALKHNSSLILSFDCSLFCKTPWARLFAITKRRDVEHVYKLLKSNDPLFSMDTHFDISQSMNELFTLTWIEYVQNLNKHIATIGYRKVYAKMVKFDHALKHLINLF